MKAKEDMVFRLKSNLFQKVKALGARKKRAPEIRLTSALPAPRSF